MDIRARGADKIKEMSALPQPVRRVVTLDPGDPRYAAHLAARRHSLFVSPRWARVVADVYGFQPALLGLFLDDQLAAALPYAEIEDFRGARRQSFPFSDHCDPTDPSAWPELEAAIAQGAATWRVRSTLAPRSADQSRTPGLSQRLHLGIDEPSAFERLHPKVRQNLRQAADAGLRARIDASPEGVRAFYSLHTLVRARKHRLLPQPFAFFERIREEFFGEDGFILFAEIDGAAVAAMFFVVYDGVLYYKFSASDLERLDLRPNHFLLWEAVRYAIARGLDAIDLGNSAEAGLQRFKRRFGAEEIPVHVASYHPVEPAPHVRALEATLAGLTHTLTADDVPLERAAESGALLYRFFV